MMTHFNGCGYVMSNEQISELWHYDMYMANAVMDLPLRTCSAVPKSLPDFPSLEPHVFQKLKNDIRSMWILASNLFQCNKGPHGWGLFFSDSHQQNGRVLFSSKKGLALGWLAKAPAPAVCPTGHRYLRSTWTSEKKSAYLGGPVGLANYDPQDRVVCQRLDANTVGMWKDPKKIIKDGLEVLWSYGLTDQNQQNIPWRDESEWWLDCCLEGTGHSQPHVKKRRVVSLRPVLTDGSVSPFKLCTFCGSNEAVEAGEVKKANMKRHWALHHTIEVCYEMGVDPNNPHLPVSAKDFMKHLDKMDHVYNSLNSHNYKVVPACNFFDIRGIPVLPRTAQPHQKESVFKEFVTAGKEAFQQYQVVFLKGITIPQKYDDLLKQNGKSGYGKVSWGEQKPSGNNFSLVPYSLTTEERDKHNLDIKTHLQNAVLGWMS